MRILLVSKDGDALDLALRLQQEGHEVALAIQDKAYKKVGDGFGLRKVKDWRKELPCIGKDGLIIFDQNGWGKDQDELRKAGYSVVGSSEGGDKLEFDRKHAQEVFKKCGMKTVRSRHFISADEAISFVKRNKGRWVVKQNGHADKCFAYTGELEDSSDVIKLLENYQKNYEQECASIDLQQRVDGVELAVARYFNGCDWVGPLLPSIEHKKYFPKDLGPNTSEMGTLMWACDPAKSTLFSATIAKMTPYLKKINFRGCFDINYIVNEHGAYPLEATPRFGYPALYLQGILHRTRWGLFLKSVADGASCALRYQKAFGVVVLIATPPFPFMLLNSKYNPEGLSVSFKSVLTTEEESRIHWCEICRDKGEHIVAGKSGYVLCVTGHGKTARQASSQVYGLAEKLCVPRMFYRNDIGKKFIEHDRALLKKWGYV